MNQTMHRRQFLKTASIGAAAVSMTAASYGRVQGANERLRVGIIGCGQRGRGAHMPGLHRYDKEMNAEIVAVCDPWRVPREEAAAMVKDWYGTDARQCVSYRDVLAMDDVDAVMIASCDHQHTTHLKAAAEAKKQIYCEKPLAMDLGRLNDAVDAVKANGVVVQIGTQLRSLPSMTGCKKLYQTGVLGTVGRVEQRRNGHRPYWYSRIKEVKEEDVDWQEFLMDREMRPFDPVVYSGWYGYRDFSDGPVPGLGSHFLDLVHYITGASFPVSAVSMGGTFTWQDEHHFTCPDHVQAEWIYPEGFMVSYCTNFGNGSGNSFKFYGNEAVLDCVNWSEPMLRIEGVESPKGKTAEPQPVEHVEMPDHALDWLQCIRNGGTPNASIDAGYQEAVACLLAVRAFDSGQRQVFDPEKRAIKAG